MITTHKFPLRGVVLGFAAVLACVSFLLTSPAAHMQTATPPAIAFDRYDDAVGYTKIFTMNADGTDVTDLGRGFGPSWSSDGQKIAFAYGDSETSDIWTMNADGSNRVQVTQNYNSFAPAWSPDGTKIAFTSYHDSGYHVYVINADGTNQQRLNVTAPEVTHEHAPTWSPDGSKVVFLGEKVVNGLQRYDYYAADANNSGATTQLTSVNYLFDQTRAAVAPDFSRLVARYNHNLQSFKLDGSNSVTTVVNYDSLAVSDPDFAPGGSKLIYTHGTMLSIVNADGTGDVNLDVVGSNADWNPTAVVGSPTPTPTPTPTPAITADLDVDAYASTLTPMVGSQMTYTIDVSNLGGNTATGVAVNAQVPSTVTVVTVQTPQGSCAVSNGQLDCQLGSVAANAQFSITLTVTVYSVGFVSTTFAGTAIETDPDLSNNSQTVGVTVSGPCAAPVTAPIEITRWQWRRDDRNAQDELILTIRNVSGRSLDPRLIFVFDNVPSGVTIDPSVVAGYTQCSTPQGSPYLVSYAPNKKEWKDMQTVSVRVLFNNPSRGSIPFNWRLYSGEVNP